MPVRRPVASDVSSSLTPRLGYDQCQYSRLAIHEARRPPRKLSSIRCRGPRVSRLPSHRGPGVIPPNGSGHLRWGRDRSRSKTDPFQSPIYTHPNVGCEYKSLLSCCRSTPILCSRCRKLRSWPHPLWGLSSKASCTVCASVVCYSKSSRADARWTNRNIRSSVSHCVLRPMAKGGQERLRRQNHGDHNGVLWSDTYNGVQLPSLPSPEFCLLQLVSIGYSPSYVVYMVSCSCLLERTWKPFFRTLQTPYMSVK